LVNLEIVPSLNRPEINTFETILPASRSRTLAKIDSMLKLKPGRGRRWKKATDSKFCNLN
jgi:hypothetical protein